MVIRRCAWHRRYYGYSVVCGLTDWTGPGLRFSDWMCRRCATRVRQSLGHGAAGATPAPRPAMGWDPVVVAPPAVALLAVLAMLLMVANPIHQAAPAPELVEPAHDTGALSGSPMYASARPNGSGRPIPLSIRERTTLGAPAGSPTLRAEVRSPLLVVPVSGPLDLRSIQAP